MRNALADGNRRTRWKVLHHAADSDLHGAFNDDEVLLFIVMGVERYPHARGRLDFENQIRTACIGGGGLDLEPLPRRGLQPLPLCGSNFHWPPHSLLFSCGSSKVLSTFAARPSRELLNQSHTRIIVPGVLSNPKFAPIVAAEIADFGFEALDPNWASWISVRFQIARERLRLCANGHTQDENETNCGFLRPCLCRGWCVGPTSRSNVSYLYLAGQIDPPERISAVIHHRARSMPLDRHIESVSKTPLGGDHADRCSTYGQLASQPRDANVNAPVENVFDNPGCPNQMLAGERTLR